MRVAQRDALVSYRRSFAIGMLRLDRARPARVADVVATLGVALFGVLRLVMPPVPALFVVPALLDALPGVLLGLLLGLLLVGAALVALVSLVLLALPLETPGELLLVSFVVAPLRFGEGRSRSTSPPAVPLTPLRCILPEAGMQLVELDAFVPVPLAPFVVFRPVNR